MRNVVKLDLDREGYLKFYYFYDAIYSYMKDMDKFLEKHDDMNTLCFSKKVMMGMEIQANNSIEGIKDDLEVIDKVIHDLWGKVSCDERTRIINLYHGYQYILKNPDINKTNLKRLYSILSKNLLDSYSREHMGKFYREGFVYIMGNQTSSFKKAVSYDKLNYYMEDFFDYVHDKNDYTSIETFLKSQIMHLYFVYVHPYFDVNGRTARTVSMWYLLNHQDYAFVIFNRAISYYRKKYIEYVGKGCSSGNITEFLQYMFIVVLRELEREYLVNDISSNSGYKLTSLEEQMIEYFLMIQGNVTLKKLMSVYYHYNSRVDFNEIYYNRIYPLIEKNILVVDKNGFIYLNKNYISINGKDLKYLKVKSK